MDSPWYIGFGIFSVLATITNIIILVSVKFNDLKHIGLKQDRHSEHLDELFEKQDYLNQRVATIEGWILGLKNGKSNRV